MPRDFKHPPMRSAPPREKGIRGLLRHLKNTVVGFTSRLFYIISLVWEASPFVLIFMALFCILDGLLPVVGAYISKELLNGIADLIGAESAGSIKANIFGTLRPVLFLLLMEFIYLFFKRVLQWANSGVTAVAGELVVNHIKLKIANKAKTVDMCSFDNPAFYEKLENANREAGMRPIGILAATFNVISAVISVASFIVVLATLSPWAPVIIIAAALPGAIVNYFYRHKNFRYMRHHSKDRREMNYYSEMMVNKDLVKEVKILGLGDTFVEKYQSAFKRYFKGLKNLILRENVLRIVVSLLATGANCFLFAYVAYDVIFSNGMIGDYSLYTGALSSVTTYVTTLVTATATIYEGTLFIDNMIEFMKEKNTVVSILPEPLKPERGKAHVIEFRGVSFSYPGTDRKVLDGINLTLKSGERAVLVGLNGAGKTTLIKLLTRLYDPTEGAIYLDGRDIREYDPTALYDMFGIIFQDFGKYAVTVAENISFGDITKPRDEEKIRAAAISADSDAFISELPRGYDTPLTRMFEENGIELSGGQWQKLSVARAFYKDSDVLILDEPTAALDALAEQAIFNQFARLAEGKISIFVSHRLSSAVTADKIVVLKGGKIVELGTHKELMASGGEYSLLFSTQAHRYTEQ
ncbi:MAG: ABC transporter ATP-binding protein [Clostridia bacterium]|nr:ABC transporter ATP-binding protein [Clostridia bacterium]